MINETFALVGTGFILALGYMVMGIGTTRAVAKMKGREIGLFEIFFWPVVLVVVAAIGDIN